MSPDSKNSTHDRIRSQCILPIVRTTTREEAVETGRAAIAGGMTVVELTMSTPNVFDAAATLVDDGAIVGIGTIEDPDDIERAADAGASFVVSYTNPAGFLEAADRHGLASIPGAFTPTEVGIAVRGGASAVKIYPGRLSSPQYITDLRAVLGPFDVMISGGIEPTTAGLGPWVRSGAFAIGCGTSLGTVANDGADVVEERCRKALAIIEQQRTQASTNAPDTVRKQIEVPGIGNPQWYSGATVYRDLIWTAGQIPRLPNGEMAVKFGEQVKATLDNIESVLEACGGGLDTLIKTNVYLTDLGDFEAFNERYVQRVGPHGLPPRTTVQIVHFPPPMRIEVEVVAHVRP